MLQCYTAQVPVSPSNIDVLDDKDNNKKIMINEW